LSHLLAGVPTGYACRCCSSPLLPMVVRSSSVHSPTSRGEPAPLSAALRRVVTRPPPLLPLRRLPLLLLAVVLRCATAVANNVMPPAPHDWVYLEHHSVGNPADCGSPSAKCHNLDPPEQLAQLSCPKSPGAAKCMEEATKACDEHATCIAFAFCNVGSEDSSQIARYQLWEVGVANAVPNTDWYLYAKRKDCSSCPAGSVKMGLKAPKPDTTTTLRPLEQYMCADKANGMAEKDNALVYCYAHVSWGTPLVLTCGFLALAYVGTGVVFGRRREGAKGPLLQQHPHWNLWRELGGLVADGVTFTSGRLLLRRASGRSRAGRGGGGGGGGGGRSEPLLAAAGGGGGSGGGGGGGGRKSKRGSRDIGSSQKKKSKSKIKKGGRKEKDKDKDVAAALAMLADAPPAPQPAREWAPTRTGHLAVGARETGVKVQMS
jgi:uncharacterized membrane protein YgcG